MEKYVTNVTEHVHRTICYGQEKSCAFFVARNTLGSSGFKGMRNLWKRPSCLLLGMLKDLRCFGPVSLPNVLETLKEEEQDDENLVSKLKIENLWSFQQDKLLKKWTNHQN